MIGREGPEDGYLEQIGNASRAHAFAGAWLSRSSETLLMLVATRDLTDHEDRDFLLDRARTHHLKAREAWDNSDTLLGHLLGLVEDPGDEAAFRGFPKDRTVILDYVEALGGAAEEFLEIVSSLDTLGVSDDPAWRSVSASSRAALRFLNSESAAFNEILEDDDE